MRPLTLLLGCLAIPRVAAFAQAVSPPPSPAAVRRAVVAARLQVDSALARRDTAALGAVLADDAVLIRRADTLRGRAAIVAFVAGGIDGVPEIRLSYAPNRMDECAAGALDEVGGDFILLLMTEAKTDTVRGRYAARWKVDAGGAARLSTLILASARNTPIPRLRGCGVAQRAAFAGRRLQVVLPTPFQTGAFGTVNSVDDEFAARGYANGGTPGLNNTLPTRQHAPPVTVAVRARIRGPWLIEAYTTLGGMRGDVRGYRAADSSYFRGHYLGHHRGLVLAYERQGVRIGVGPALLWTTWATQEEGLWDTGAGWQTSGIRGSGTSDEVLTGVVVQAAFVFPLSPRLFVEARAQARRFPESSAPAAGRVPSTAADHNGHTIAVAFGAAL